MTATCTCPTTLSYEINGVSLVIDRAGAVPRPSRRAVALAAVAVALAILLVPDLAFGDVIGDFFKNLFEGFCDDQFAQIEGMFSEIGDYGGITSTFDTILGTGSVSIADLAENVAQYTVFPVACVVFSLAIMMQLLKVAQRIDQTGNLPAVKEVIFLFCWVAICIYVIGHSFELVRELYAVVNGFVRSVTIDDPPQLKFHTELGDDFLGNLGFMLGLVITEVLLHLVAILVAVTSTVMFLARGIQIYLYAMFAPLTLSFLGFDEMRPWAVGYIKGLLSVLISGFIMAFAIAAWPYLLAGMVSGSAEVTKDLITVNVTGGANSTWVVGILAASFGLFTVLVKSGSFAREIMGG